MTGRTTIVASSLLVLSSWLGAAHAAALPSRQTIAITAVTIIDVEHGRSLGPRTVLVEAGRIAAIGTARDVPLPAGTQRVDGRGRFLIPGLVDMHVHLFNLSSHRPANDWTFPLFVANGVTGVREMRADADALALTRQWRQDFDAGRRVAPRILADGIAVYGRSPEDAARQVDAAAQAGADFIKVFSEVPEANWRAILVEAKMRSLPVTGHVPAGVPLLVAAQAGQRSSEHLYQAYEACSSIEGALLEERRGLDGDALVERRDAQEARALSSFDAGTCERIARQLATTGQFQVPTLVLANEDAWARKNSPESDPRWRLLRADEHPRWQGFLAGYTPADAQLAAKRWPIAHRIVAIFHRAGVPILAGTDTPMPGVYPGYSLHEEMAMLVDAGLSPREALRSATLLPAQYLGIADASGSIAIGKRADLVLLDADPTRDIHNSQRIRAVLLDGRLLRRNDLDALLAAGASAP